MNKLLLANSLILLVLTALFIIDLKINSQIIVFAEAKPCDKTNENINDPLSFKVDDCLLINETGNEQKSYFENKCADNVSIIGCYLVRLVNILSVLIGIVSFGAIVIGGLILVTAGGDDTQIGKGKDTIFYAIIGLVVTLSAYIISVFVQSIFY